MLQKTNFAISEIQDVIKDIDYILSQIKSDSLLLNQVLDHISGGKHLRPILLLACARSFNFYDKIIYDSACIVEYIHIASLLHDDVIDESQKRRGKKSINSIYGNRIAIMSGDYLYSLAYNKILGINIDVAKEISKAAYNLSLGEIKEIEHFFTIISKEDYFDIIYKKTACLIESACVSGCLLANAGDFVENIRLYGKNLGLAFQIKDDVMDYSNKDIGKDTFNDIKEGKATLPMLLALEKDPHLKRYVNEYFETKNQDILKYCIESIINNGLNEALEIARQRALNAKKAIEPLQENIYKDILNFLADYSISREK